MAIDLVIWIALASFGVGLVLGAAVMSHAKEMPPSMRDDLAKLYSSPSAETPPGSTGGCTCHDKYLVWREIQYKRGNPVSYHDPKHCQLWLVAEPERGRVQ